MLRYAGIPSIVFLVLLEWALAAGGLALAGRTADPRSRGHWLASAASAIFLAGAFSGLVAIPAEETGLFRWILLAGALLAIFCWGRLALLPLPDAGAPEEILRANRQWSIATASIHAALALGSAYWFCDWFVLQHATGKDGLPLRTLWMALSILLNRGCGAAMIAFLALGAAEGFQGAEESSGPERIARIEGLAQEGLSLAGWRATALGMSIALGIADGPLGRLFLFHDSLISDGLLIGVRILVGIAIPAFLSWFAGRLAAAGDAKGAGQQLPPALIMALIGEALGAGLTFGLTGLGF